MIPATLLPRHQDMPPQPNPLASKPSASAAAPSAVLASMDRIVLTGFMGSGKTTAGSLLAALLGWSFVDLDHEIERRDGRSVPEIFGAPGITGGESYFRRLETTVLASLLGQRNIVVALGGGAPETLANRLLLEQTPRTGVVYLAAPFQTLLHRCTAQAADPSSTARPVLADAMLAERRFHLRHPHYQRIASHTLDTSTLTAAQTSGAILDLLQPGKP